MRSRLAILKQALWRLFEDSGFSMAGAVAFSFVVSLFPFCIFLGALAGWFGGRELAVHAVEQLFLIVPDPVAQVLAPQVEAVMGQSRFDLLTLGAFISLFFATSAIESLRAALNVAYRVKEQRSYFWCIGQSALFVFASAVGMLVLAWGILVGPMLAARFKLPSVVGLLDTHLVAVVLRYGIVIVVLLAQLAAYHLWLTAGKRRLADVWPGVVVSAVLWLITAWLYAAYLDFNDYSRFYAGLTQLMSALIFFQVTSMIVILGAEFNRALSEAKVGIGETAPVD
jgi:membrane protein